MPGQVPPLIVVTVADPSRQSDPALAARKNELYAAGVRRHGGRPLLLDASTGPAARAASFERMGGLLLTGGADIEPARYGRSAAGSVDVDRERDELEAAAWTAAGARGLPVLGICRGLQAINVFAGGTLVQHVGGHAGPSWGTGPALMHEIRIVAQSRLGRALGGASRLDVNAYHHQAVTAHDLAPTLVATAWADSPAGEIVEGLEAPGERFVVGVQCHPERTESTPMEFDGLWAAFVEACRERDGRVSRGAGTGTPRASR